VAKIRCKNGIEVDRITVMPRQGRMYIYGVYYDNGRTRTCYIAPEEPRNILDETTAVGYIVRPDRYSSMLTNVLERIADLILLYPSTDVKNNATKFGEQLIKIGEKIKQNAENIKLD
jgi:hypothetical protein